MKHRFFNDSGHAHYLTFSCYRRQQLLNDDITRLWLVQSIDQARKKHRFKLWAWVIMPEHVHMLLHPVVEGYSIARIMQLIKGPFARRLIGEWRDHAPHKLARLCVNMGGKESFRLWQAGGGFDRNLYQMSRIKKAIEYIEYNPVRRGLVIEPAEWRWSSARARMGTRDALLLIDDFEFENERITGDG